MYFWYIYEKLSETQKEVANEKDKMIQVNKQHKQEHIRWDQEKDDLNTEMRLKDQQFIETNRAAKKVKFASQIVFVICCVAQFFFFCLNRIQYSFHPCNEQHYYYFFL